MKSSDAQPAISDQQFIDYIYDIALDPGNLNSFIDRLEGEVANSPEKCLELGRIETLSALFESHLTRAEKFLDRIPEDDRLTPAQAVLAPFDATPAVLVNNALEVLDANHCAVDAFGIAPGDSVDAMPFQDDDVDVLFMSFRKLLREQSGKGVLLSLRLKESLVSTTDIGLFHAHWLEIDNVDDLEVAGRRGFILLVSTETSWPIALDQTLRDVFALTSAERDIVRALVQGTALKSIANDRDTSLGTVRTQLKSVLTKTRTHSQSELIRVTLSLMEIVKRSPLASAPGVSGGASGWSEFETLKRPDGRKVDYLVQGDPDGKPVLFSHMGYGLLRWPSATLELAIQNQLKIICPVRCGFGGSDPVSKDADILQITRDDTAALLDWLEVESCPYVAQGNDLIFAMDFATHYRDRITSIIGLGPRLPLAENVQYAGMGKWHRFLLSTARHAPHLLYFTAKAAFALAQKIGREQMFRNVHRNSPADLAIIDDPDVSSALLESSKIAVNSQHHAAFAYAKELFVTESDWGYLVETSRNVPAWYVSGLQDPLGDPSTIAAYREAWPWIQIDTIEDAGQLLFFQKFHQLVPRIAATAHDR